MNVELASFVAVALLGAVITWRKAGKVLGVIALARNPYAAVQDDCDHVHMPPPEELEPPDALARHGGRGARRRHPPLRGRPHRPGLRPVAGPVRGRHRRDLRHGARHGAHHRRHRGARGLLQGGGVENRRRTRRLGRHRDRGARASGRRLRAGAGGKPPLRPLGRLADEAPATPPSERGSCTASTRPLRGCFTSMPAWPSASA